MHYKKLIRLTKKKREFVCFSQTAIRTLEKCRLERALAEFKRLEARCVAKNSGGWIRAVRRKLLFAAPPATVHDYDRQIALADATACTVGLTMASHAADRPSVATMARAVYALRRAWKMYQQSYAAVLGVYRNVYDLEGKSPGERGGGEFKKKKKNLKEYTELDAESR